MWIQQAKELPVIQAAKALGLQKRRGRSLGPCPACNSETRGTSDNRGPIGVNGSQVAWKCHRCGIKGDVVDLASFRLHELPFRELPSGRQLEVRTWFSEQGACPKPGETSVPPGLEGKKALLRVIEDGYRRPPQEELHGLWRATCSFEKSLNDDPEWADPMATWLLRRKFAPLLLDQCKAARVLPPPGRLQMPEWWRKEWLPNYRVAVPVYEPDGTFASIHARSVAVPEINPKTRWPYRYEASELVMANPNAVRMMRGQKVPGLTGLLICEGLTDFIRACCAAHSEEMTMAIVAAASGGFKAIPKIQIPKTIKIYIATDPDDRGDEYATVIADGLPDHKVYRVPLEA